MEDLGRVGFFLYFYLLIYSWLPGSLLLRLGFLGCSPLLTRASHCDAFSCCRAWALGRTWASGVVGHGLQSTDSVAVVRRLNCPVESSQARDLPRVSCIGWWILNHRTTLGRSFWLEERS